MLDNVLYAVDYLKLLHDESIYVCVCNVTMFTSEPFLVNGIMKSTELHVKFVCWWSQLRFETIMIAFSNTQLWGLIATQLGFDKAEHGQMIDSDADSVFARQSHISSVIDEHATK